MSSKRPAGYYGASTLRTVPRKPFPKPGDPTILKSMEESRQLAQRLKCLPLELRRLIYESYWAVNPGWLPWIYKQRGNETVKEPGRLHLIAPIFFGNEIAREALQTAYETTECTISKESIPVDELRAFLRSKTLPLRLVPKTFIQRLKIHLSLRDLLDATHDFTDIGHSLKELSQIGDPSAFLHEKPTPLSVTLLLDTEIIVPCLVYFLQNDHVRSILEKLVSRPATVNLEYHHHSRENNDPIVFSWNDVREKSKKEISLMLLDNCNKLQNYSKFLKYEGLGAKPRTDDVTTLGTDYWGWMVLS